jgi:hypothetical protein
VILDRYVLTRPKGCGRPRRCTRDSPRVLLRLARGQPPDRFVVPAERAGEHRGGVRRRLRTVMRGQLELSFGVRI